MKYSILFLMLIVVISFSLVSAETFGYGRTESTPINYSTIPTGDNSSWNESYADTLYMDINEATGNSSFNQSLTDDLYAKYQFEDNNFNGSGNVTASYFIGNGSLLTGVIGTAGTNGTDGIDGINGTNGTDGINGTNLFTSLNETQFDNSTGVLNVKETWFESLWNTIFGTKDTDDLIEGSANLYDNSSWNESHANSLYAGIEWDYNQTLATYNAWNSVWLSTYNSTYAAKANYQFEDNNFNGMEFTVIIYLEI